MAEDLAVAVAAMARVGAAERATVGMGLGRRMDEAAAPAAAGPSRAAGLAAGKVRLAPAGATATGAPRRPAVGRGHRGMAGMARCAVWFPVRAHHRPTPAAWSARKDGPSAEPTEVTPHPPNAGLQFTRLDVADCQGPELRPVHPLGESVVSLQQTSHSRSFAVGAASDVTGQRSGHARPTGAMRQDSDQGAVAQGASPFVEPESTLDIAGLVSAAAAFAENVGKVELGRLALGRIAK